MNLGMLGPARQLWLRFSHVHSQMVAETRIISKLLHSHIWLLDNQLEAGTFLAPWLSIETWSLHGCRVANFLQGGYRFSEQGYPEKLAEASGYLETLKSLEKSYCVTSTMSDSLRGSQRFIQVKGREQRLNFLLDDVKKCANMF